MSELQMCLLGALTVLGGAIVIILTLVIRPWIPELATGIAASAGTLILAAGAVLALAGYFALI